MLKEHVNGNMMKEHNRRDNTVSVYPELQNVFSRHFMIFQQFKSRSKILRHSAWLKNMQEENGEKLHLHDTRS